MEEIIIDGVNVAGCVLYNNGKCRDLGHLVQGEYMECNSMCDYGAYARKEQLKRLEQEKSTIEYMLHLAEQENAELKARLQTLDDEVLTVEITPDEFERYKKYKRILEEIRRTMQDIIEDNGRHNLSEYSSPIRIEKIVNEDLGND